MSQHQTDERRIFHIAREISADAARCAYLDQIGHGDQRLRDRVEALLDVFCQERSLLKSNDASSPTQDAARWLEEMPGNDESGYPSKVRCERERLSHIANRPIYPFHDEPYHRWHRLFLDGIHAYDEQNWDEAIDLLTELLDDHGRSSNRYYWAEVLRSEAKKHRLRKEAKVEN